jgi:hypothetical protein
MIPFIKCHILRVRHIEDLDVTEFFGKELPFALGGGICISVVTFMLVQLVVYMCNDLLVCLNVPCNIHYNLS